MLRTILVPAAAALLVAACGGSDDATAAVPYVFLDGELEPPAPTLPGAEGGTVDVVVAATGDVLAVDPL